MASKPKAVLPTTYSNAGELRFPPRGQVTITVTNGPAVCMLAAVSAVSTWQNAPYDGTERELLPGVWVYDATDLGGLEPCAVQVRSTATTQLATVSISA